MVLCVMCIQIFGIVCYVYTDLWYCVLCVYRSLVLCAMCLQIFGIMCCVSADLWYYVLCVCRSLVLCVVCLQIFGIMCCVSADLWYYVLCVCRSLVLCVMCLQIFGIMCCVSAGDNGPGLLCAGQLSMATGVHDHPWSPDRHCVRNVSVVRHRLRLSNQNGISLQNDI